MLIRFSLDPEGIIPVPPGERRYLILPRVGLYLHFRHQTWWSFVSDWRKVTAALVLLGLLAYLGAATLLHAHWATKPGNKVEWVDVALAPFRWEEFRVRRGETAIAGALLSLERGELSQAFFDLSAGVVRAPRHTKGRTLLVEMIGYWDPNRAQQLLNEGLELDPADPELLRALFSFQEIHHAPALTLETVAPLLDGPQAAALSPLARARCVNARATALLALERAAEADDLLVAAALDPATDEGRRALRLRIRAALRTQRFAEADTAWKQLTRAQPDAPENHLFDGEIALASADDERLARAIRRIKVAYPDTIDPLLFAYRAWHQRGRTTLRDGIEAEIFTYYPDDNAALQRFGTLLVELDLPEALKRTQNFGVRNGLNPFAFQAQMTDLALRRHDFDEAFRTLQQWEWLLSNVRSSQRGYPEFLRRLVRATVDGGTANTTLLVNHLIGLRGQVTPEHFKYAITALERAGKLGAATQVAEIGHRYFPFAEALQADGTRVRAALERQNAEQADSQRTARQLIEGKIGDAETVLAQLDAALAAGQFISARNQLQQVRIVRPAWYGENESAIELRRLKLAVLTEEAVDARIVVRRYLGAYRTAEDALGVLAFARKLVDAKQEGAARLLQSEVASARGTMPEVAEALEGFGPDQRWLALTQSRESALALIDQQLARLDPDSVLALLDQLNNARPDWLEDARPALEMREFRSRWALQQKPSAMLIFRNLVLKQGVRRAAAFQLVRELIAEGDRATAQLLAKEINTLLPDDRAALKLQQEAEAPAPNPGA